MGDDVEVIEAEGQYLMPGLAEMHGHLPSPRMLPADAKNLLFAALILADEVEEARDKPSPATEPGFDTDRLGNQLERMAIALENAASTLEGSGSTS
mgnify:CR=1 FL=1